MPEMPLQFRRAAITAQQLSSIDADVSLIGRDGMNKTTVWKNCAYLGTSQMRKRSLCGRPGVNAKWGFHPFMTTRGEE
jgi:hypothetical protein